MEPKKETKVVTITDVPAEDLDRVTKDYSDSGASVVTTRQEDGKYTIEARFQVGAKYPASSRPSA